MSLRVLRCPPRGPPACSPAKPALRLELDKTGLRLSPLGVSAPAIFERTNVITLALSKGRIFDETLPLLEAAGIRVLEDPEKSRKLILATNRPDVGGGLGGAPPVAPSVL